MTVLPPPIRNVFPFFNIDDLGDGSTYPDLFRTKIGAERSGFGGGGGGDRPAADSGGGGGGGGTEVLMAVVVVAVGPVIL